MSVENFSIPLRIILFTKPCSCSIMLTNCNNNIKAGINFFMLYIAHNPDKLGSLVGRSVVARSAKPTKFFFSASSAPCPHTATFPRQQLLALSSKFLTLSHTHTHTHSTQQVSLLTNRKFSKYFPEIIHRRAMFFAWGGFFLTTRFHLYRKRLWFFSFSLKVFKP